MKINTDLVRHLIAEQFPIYADLPVRMVAKSGHDNRTFHLGDTLSVRLPSGEGYAAQVTKEQRWLPYLQQQLTLPITQQVAVGKPSLGYPYSWSICHWLPGETAKDGNLEDLHQFARDLAGFLRDLQKIDCHDGPSAGRHNYYRGGNLAVYTDDVARVLQNEQLNLQADRNVLKTIWETALATTWTDRPVWVHGDVAPTNMLVMDGRLSAVIDFGVLGTGDPSCDLVMAWTFFYGQNRQTFKDHLPYNADVWQRAKGWALWKALLIIEESQGNHHTAYLEAVSTIHEILAD